MPSEQPTETKTEQSDREEVVLKAILGCINELDCEARTRVIRVAAVFLEIDLEHEE